MAIKKVNKELRRLRRKQKQILTALRRLAKTQNDRILKSLESLQKQQREQECNILQLVQKLQQTHLLVDQQQSSTQTIIENAIRNGVSTVVASGNSANMDANMLKDVQNTLSPDNQKQFVCNSLLQ